MKSRIYSFLAVVFVILFIAAVAPDELNPTFLTASVTKYFHATSNVLASPASGDIWMQNDTIMFRAGSITRKISSNSFDTSGFARNAIMTSGGIAYLRGDTATISITLSSPSTARIMLTPLQSTVGQVYVTQRTSSGFKIYSTGSELDSTAIAYEITYK